MARPTNKVELLAAARQEFDRLWSAVALIPPEAREQPGACESWSVKDLLAHLDAWHRMTLEWESAGSSGATPEVPGHGYSWAQTPALNQMLFERAANDSWRSVEQRLRHSHADLLTAIEAYSDDDLFTKKRYPWTGSTSVGAYFVSASSSHYAWATKLIRKWAKAVASA